MDKPVLERIGEKADRRTELAADRTVLAVERTYAAWMRTGFAALASGVGARTLLAGALGHWLVMVVATILILFSGFCFGAAVWRELFAGTPPPKPDVQRIPRSVLYLINGFLALVSLAALVGIWMQPFHRV
jgi:putative membrane protein